MNEILFCKIAFVYTFDFDEVDIATGSGWEINSAFGKKGLFLALN